MTYLSKIIEEKRYNEVISKKKKSHITFLRRRWRQKRGRKNMIVVFYELKYYIFYLTTSLATVNKIFLFKIC